MGVDYSTTVGYGFAIPINGETEELARDAGYAFPEWGYDSYEFGEKLVEGLHLKFATVGDFYSGDDCHILVCAASTMRTVDLYGYNSGVQKFGEGTLQRKELRDLERVYARLYGAEGLRDGYIGWMTAMTVS